MREVGAPGWAVLSVMADYLPRTHTQVMEGCELVFAGVFQPQRSTLSRALHRLVGIGYALKIPISIMGMPYKHHLWQQYQITDKGYQALRESRLVWKRLLAIS